MIAFFDGRCQGVEGFSFLFFVKLFLVFDVNENLWPIEKRENEEMAGQ